MVLFYLKFIINDDFYITIFTRSLMEISLVVHRMEFVFQKVLD